MQAEHKRSTLQSLAMAFYPIVSLPFSMLYPVRHDCFSFFFQSFLHQLLTSPCSSKSMSFGTTDGDRGGPELLNARAACSRPLLRPVQDVAGRARRAKVHTAPTGRARRDPLHHPKYTPRATSGLSLPSRGLTRTCATWPMRQTSRSTGHNSAAVDRSSTGRPKLVQRKLFKGNHGAYAQLFCMRAE